MSDPQNNNPSGFFEVINKSTLAVSKKAAGAGVIGLVGFGAILAVAALFFITENYFVAMLFISLALLVYATGAEIGKLMLSTMTVFFSSRHLTPKAAQLQQTLAALEETLTLRRDRDGELRVGPVEKGMRVRLPDNPLVRDLVTVQERQKGYDYAEYIVYSYYVECHELYDHSSAHLDFVSGAMPLFGLMGTVLGPHQHVRQPRRRRHRRGDRAAAGAGAQVHALRRRLLRRSTRSRRRASSSASRASTTTYDTLCRALKVIFDNERRRRGAEVRRATHAPRLRRAFDIWQIVYIDLMTNVMIFFVVLWAVQSAPEQERHQRHDRHRDGEDGEPAGRRARSRRARAICRLPATRSCRKLFADDTHTVLNFDVGPAARSACWSSTATPTTTAPRTRTSTSATSARSPPITRSRSTAATCPITSSSARTPTTRPPQEVPAFGGDADARPSSSRSTRRRRRTAASPSRTSW